MRFTDHESYADWEQQKRKKMKKRNIRAEIILKSYLIMRMRMQLQLSKTFSLRLFFFVCVDLVLGFKFSNMQIKTAKQKIVIICDAIFFVIHNTHTHLKAFSRNKLRYYAIPMLRI